MEAVHAWSNNRCRRSAADVYCHVALCSCRRAHRAPTAVALPLASRLLVPESFPMLPKRIRLDSRTTLNVFMHCDPQTATRMSRCSPWLRTLGSAQTDHFRWWFGLPEDPHTGLALTHLCQVCGEDTIVEFGCIKCQRDRAANTIGQRWLDTQFLMMREIKNSMQVSRTRNQA
jgi:hypothetical protein